MPEVRRLLIGDRPEAWIEAGFAVDGDRTTIGTVAIRFAASPGDSAANDADASNNAGTSSNAGASTGAGLLGWEIAGAEEPPSDIDGIVTSPTTDPAPSPVVHPNGVSRLDHIVVATPNLARTITGLETAGFETRRTRDIPGTDPVRRQVFLWAGEPILEVVGTVEPSGDGPASLWGLALTTDDLDGAAELLGPKITCPKDAVQPGRRIATIDTRGLGIGPGLALMTPHVTPPSG